MNIWQDTETKKTGSEESICYLWSVYRTRNRAYEILRSAKFIAVTRIRLQFDFPLPTEDDDIDKKISNAVNTFFSFDPESRNTNPENGYSEILQWLKNDEISKNHRKEYFRVFYWLETEAGNKDEAIAIASTYRCSYKEELKPTDISEIRETYSKLKKEFRDVQREFLNSRANRIDLDLKNLTFLLLWFPAVFIVAAYIYTSALYGHFGIDVTKFFSMNDYVAISLKEIFKASWLVCAFFVGFVRAYRDPRAQVTQHRSEKRRYGHIVRYILCCLSLLTILYNEEFFLEIIEPIVTIHILYIAIPLVVFVSHRYFKNSMYVFCILFGLVALSSSFYISKKTRIRSIEQGYSSIDFEIESANKKFTQENFTFIGGNSRYIFLYSTKDSNVEVLPIKSTRNIKMRISDAERNLEIRRSKNDIIKNTGRRIFKRSELQRESDE